ncbi:hypothetical protein KC351_g5690 [Hortaea werneckii]|nr:hypothetical protein KC351_g5690 [Hortaea werneckii]
MTLPSSPPLLPEQDLPNSPTFPALASAQNGNAGLNAASRKRQLYDYAALSSDPVFSDASTDGDADQYQNEDGQPRRKKKLVRGPWWNLRQTSSQSLRRSMAKKDRIRNGDSGVWMGSDESQESIDSIVSGQQRLQELAMDDIPRDDLKSDDTTPDPEVLAARIVQGCVESGKERVDLSDLALGSLSDDSLRPLQHMIKQSFAEFTHPPSEDEFVPLTPSIQLFLSRNRLAALPAELFSLTNITVLSLRNNDLRYIPPAVSRLSNLTELNVAGNSIRYLPWEVLGLLHSPDKQRQINVQPNPLWQPCDLSGPSPFRSANFTSPMTADDLSRWADARDSIDTMRARYEAEHGKLCTRGELELRLKLGRMMRTQYLQEASRAGREVRLSRDELIYLASSTIRYFGPDGTLLRQPRISQAEGPDFSATLESTNREPSSNGSHLVPSLFETALRRLQVDYNLLEFMPHLSDSGMSTSLSSAIRRATSNVLCNGNETCSLCGKNFVIARAEWMEYWFHGFSSQQELTPESVLPFLRRACSWNCARVSEAGDFRC